MEEARQIFTNISQGDKVVIGSPQYPTAESNRIETVKKVTATQIVISDYERYRRGNGYRVGGSMFSESILRVASPKDIERRTERDRKSQEEKYKRQKESDFLKSLSALFENADVHRYNRQEDSFRVELHGLSEKQVRRLAEIIKGDKVAR